MNGPELPASGAGSGPDDAAEITDDAFLGGRLACLQPRFGFRAGLDTVLLAAACPAGEGETVVEPGCGPGVAALCLAHRTGARVTGIEIEPAAAALARENAARNDLAARVCVIDADVTAKPAALEALGLAAGSFDHAIANPPYLIEGAATPPPGAARARAFAGDADLTDAWLRVCVRLVRPGGSIAVIHRADRLAGLLAAFEGRAGGLRVLPLWPGGGKPASRVIVCGIKGSRAPLTLLPGLVLHSENDGRFMPEVAAILREGTALGM